MYYTKLSANHTELMPSDILHNWELGVGKAMFVHNICIFPAVGREAVNSFDSQYVSQAQISGQMSNNTCLGLTQVLTSPHIQLGYYLKVWGKCFSDEKACYLRL